MSVAADPAQVPVRPASTLVLVRGADVPEVLLLLRHGRHGFMPNIWVFPGGRVEPDDGEDDPGARRAALRETREEAGIELGDAPLMCFSRWVTPLGERRRFDTRFYVTRVAADAAAVPDQGEVTDALWVRPADALARHREGRLALAPPTWWSMEALRRLADADAILAWASAIERAGVAPLTPTLALEGGSVVVSTSPEHLRLPPGEPFSGRLRLVRGVWLPA